MCLDDQFLMVSRYGMRKFTVIRDNPQKWDKLSFLGYLVHLLFHFKAAKSSKDTDAINKGMATHESQKTH